jgi:hypothetical protein
MLSSKLVGGTKRRRRLAERHPIDCYMPQDGKPDCDHFVAFHEFVPDNSSQSLIRCRPYLPIVRVLLLQIRRGFIIQQRACQIPTRTGFSSHRIASSRSLRRILRNPPKSAAPTTLCKNEPRE